MLELHEQFLQERRYFRNVSPATITFYRSCFTALPLNPESWKADLLAGIQRLQARGVKPRSINDYIRGNKAFLNWCHEEGHLKEKPKLSWLKEEQKILATLTQEHIHKLVIIPTGSFGSNLRRAHLVALTILDTGLRISECLGLTKENCDLDNMVFRTRGKGNKERLVPFSMELRKLLFRYQIQPSEKGLTGPLFGTKNNTKLTVRNLNRDFQVLRQKLGITGVRFSPHTLRHTFAVSYLRAGGNLFYLSRILGHTSVKTTEHYLQSLGIEDLQAVHSKLSLLTTKP